MRPGPVGRAPRGEDGVVAVVVALLLAVAVLAGTLVLDLGSLLRTRQGLVGDLDTAALSAAIEFGDHVALRWPSTARCPPGQEGPNVGSPSTLEAKERGVALVLDASPRPVTVAPDGISVNCTFMTVTVTGQLDTVRFMSAEGDPARGSSTARYVPAIGGPVVPLSLCGNNPALEAWLAAGAPQYGTTVTIPFGDASLLCGEVPGNWGWVGSNAANTLRGWIQDGMPAGTNIDLSPTCSIPGGKDPNADGWCGGGAGLTDPPLTTLVNEYPCPTGGDCFPVTLLVHDGSSGEGSNAYFEPVAFLDVAIKGRTGSGVNAALVVEFRGYRDAPDEVPYTPSRSYLCSVETAPDDHIGCQL